MTSYHGISTGVQTPAVAQPSVVVAEFFLNRHESFRAEIIQRRGKSIVALGRWKTISGLPKRTGAAIEFAAHRAAGIANLLSDLQRILNSGAPKGGVDVPIASTTVSNSAPAGRRP